jgi:hypothetical protein
MLRNWQAALALTGFVCLGIFSVWHEYSPLKSPIQQHSAAINNSNTNTGDTTAKVAPPKSPEERIADYTWWLGAFTCALVIVSMLQIFFLTRADKNTRIAAKAASLHAKAAVGVELPAIFVTNIDFLRLKGNVDDLAIQLRSPEVKITFQNFGRTPAVLIQRCVNIIVADSLPKNPTYLVIDEYTPGNIIESQSVKTEQHGAIVFSRDIANAILSGNEFLWVYGFLIYQDFLRGLSRNRILCAMVRSI